MYLEIFEDLSDYITVEAHWTVNEAIHCLVNPLNANEFAKAVQLLGILKRDTIISEYEIGFCKLEDLACISSPGG